MKEDLALSPLLPNGTQNLNTSPQPRLAVFGMLWLLHIGSFSINTVTVIKSGCRINAMNSLEP